MTLLVPAKVSIQCGHNIIYGMTLSTEYGVSKSIQVLSLFVLVRTAKQGNSYAPTVISFLCGFVMTGKNTFLLL